MWQTIEERPNYEVSDEGEIRHTESGRIVRQHLDKDGYPNVWLSESHGKTVHRRVGRLVAQAFIPNPNGFDQVNHKDENKLNNHVNNLEWCDCRYNINYGTRTERAIAPRRKPVIAYKDGREVMRYESASKAASCLGLWQANISACCRGVKGYQIVGGYAWEYAK